MPEIKENKPKQFEDPKIILTTSLLRQRDGVVTQINAGQRSDALISMATLVSQFEIEPSRTDLLKARDELVQNTVRSSITSDKIMHYFQLISDYLNATYFADFHKAKPKYQGEGSI